MVSDISRLKYFAAVKQGQSGKDDTYRWDVTIQLEGDPMIGFLTEPNVSINAAFEQAFRRATMTPTALLMTAGTEVS